MYDDGAVPGRVVDAVMRWCGVHRLVAFPRKIKAVIFAAVLCVLLYPGGKRSERAHTVVNILIEVSLVKAF